MRNNSVLGSCDQVVRQAGGLVLELWGCTDSQGMGGAGGGGREQAPTDRANKTVEDDMLNDMCLSAPGSLSNPHTN